MKIFKKILLCLVCVVTLFSLASCSTVNKIKKAFENEGYTWTVKEVDEDTKSAGVDGIYKVNGGTLQGKLGYVIEFSTKSAQEAVDNLKAEGTITDSDVTAILNATSKVELVNGNCCLLSLHPEVIEIFKNA